LGVGILAIAGLAGAMRAQPQPAFETTSVRPLRPQDITFSQPQFLPGGRFVSDTLLIWVIGFAYDVPFSPGAGRLAGGPDWIRNLDGLYDIQATWPTGQTPAGLAAKRLALQRLLADRFKLAVHVEKKEMPVYGMVVAKSGLKLPKADVEEKDCPGESADRKLLCHSLFVDGVTLYGRAIGMADLVYQFGNNLDRPLVDKTGLEGLFHLEMKNWLTSPSAPPPPPPPPGAPGASGTDVISPAVLLLEKLGLKLESQKGIVETIVIDRIEKPTEN